MRADEFLVEKYLELEKKYRGQRVQIEDLQDEVDTAQEELADFENLVHILSKHLTVSENGVSIYLSKFMTEDKADIEYLANYFDLEAEEETQGENG